jgi:predicted type IV restriction endonuclease
MMIECKSADVKLDPSVLEQVLRYNISIPVRYLVVTNGKDHFGWARSEGRLDLVKEMPDHGK